MRYLPTLILSLLAATTLVRAASPQELIEQMVPADAALRSAAELRLDAAQQAKLRAGLAPLQREMGPLQEQMRNRTGELIALLSAAQPDEGATLAKFAELERVESQIKLVRLRMTLLSKTVLTAEQQAQLRKTSPPAPGSRGSDSIRSKLQRVRDGIERWNAEGRDVTKVRALWTEFQEQAEKRHHQQAIRALNEALELIEAPTAP